MQRAAWPLVVAGAALTAASLLADAIGLGGQAGIIGWKQWLGASAGVVLLGIGLVLARWGRRQAPTEAAGGQTAFPSVEGDEAKPIYDSAAPRVPFVHELRELHRYRFLLWNLISRDLKVRYKRSVLGFFWAMVNPLLTMAVMVIVFLNVFRFDVENYPIYLLSGILLWRLFSTGTTVAMHSVLNSSAISRKIYVPSSVFVAASIGSALVNFLFAAGPLLALALLTGVRPQVSWLYLPIPVLQTTLFSFGIGLLVAALAVFFADMLDIYEVFVNAYFYLTPIIYPVSILPAVLITAEQFNPMHHFIDGFRAALVSGVWPAPWILIGASLAALAMAAIGWSIFTRLSDRFAYLA